MTQGPPTVLRVVPPDASWDKREPESLNWSPRGGEPKKELRAPQIQGNELYTAHYSPHSSRSREKDDSSPLVTLACLQLLRRLWQGANDKLKKWQQPCDQELRGWFLGRDGSMLISARQSPGAHGWWTELLASHWWEVGDRLLSIEEQYPSGAPPCPGMWAPHSSDVNSLGSSYPMADQAHLTTSWEQVGANAWGRAGWASFLDRL